MGDHDGDRVDMLVTLANLSPAPDSVPINMLMPQADTPLPMQRRSTRSILSA